MTLKVLKTYIQMLCDPRMRKMFWAVHRDFSKDKEYRLLDFVKALWLAVKDERVVKFNDLYVHSSFLPPLPSKAAMQVFEAVPDKNTKFFNHTNAIRTAPISIYLAVTGRCGYNCNHCSAANRSRDDELPLDLLKNTIAELQNMGVGIIGLTGGEPLLRKDIIDIIRCIDDRSVSYLFTSGCGLTPEMASELRSAGLFAIGISLDSTEEEVADQRRGCKGAFQAALSAVKAAKQAGLYIMLQTVVDKEMIRTEKPTELVNFAYNLGVHEIRFIENLPTGKFLHLPAERILSEIEREKLRAFHKQMNRSNRNLPKVTVFAHAESAKLYGCGAGTQHAYIDAAGNLSPCDFVPLSFGNIRDTSMQELWSKMQHCIGKPRDKCMILELQRHIGQSQTILPLDEFISQQLVCNMRRVKSYPGFYTTLKGAR